MFENWIGLDAGADTLRFYEYSKSKEILIPNFIVYENSTDTSMAPDDYLSYVYNNNRNIQIRYPISQGKFYSTIRPLIKKGLKDLNATSNLFKPSFLVCLPDGTDQKIKQSWQQELVACGIRKVEFVSTMDVLQSQEACFMIHAGHSYTEIGIYAYQTEFAHKIIHFAGLDMDEEIKLIVAKKTNCLISNEDAKALKKAMSDSFNNQKNAILECNAFDKRGQLVRIQLRASDIWPAVEKVIQQIVLWAKSCYMNMGMDMKQRLMHNGIYLSGGLANCFGLKQALQKEFDCLIICQNNPECAIIEQMKGWK